MNLVEILVKFQESIEESFDKFTFSFSKFFSYDLSWGKLICLLVQRFEAGSQSYERKDQLH